MTWLYLLLALTSAALTFNVYRPRYRNPLLSVLSFFAGWLTGELVVLQIAAQALTTLLFGWMGAIDAWPGQIGLGVMAASWLALAFHHYRAGKSAQVVDAALREALGEDYEDRVRPELRAKFETRVDPDVILRPYRIRKPGVERIADVVYGRAEGIDLKLDIYRAASKPEDCPTLLQIHGGGRVFGRKDDQALPLMYHLAERGWVCVSVNYRLSPHATFPEHVIDVKRAMAWVREHGREYGADPEFLVVTGGSAGGHLAALTGLTANDPAYQPGFESADTSVAACVPFYGVYDLADRDGFWHNAGLADILEQKIVKGSRQEKPEVYETGSPVARVRENAPPFFVIHGDCDSLVPVEIARKFVDKLKQRSKSPTAYAELVGAQHAFEILPSLRTSQVVGGVERFCAYFYSRYLGARVVFDAEPPVAVAPSEAPAPAAASSPTGG